MKKVWKVAVAVLCALILLRISCSVASNRRLTNKLNPEWEVRGQVLSEQGTPISDVELKIYYLIGYYPIGRILEQGADSDYERLRPDTNGFFNIQKQCDSVHIQIDDDRYEIVGTVDDPDEIVFSRWTRTVHKTSDKNLKVILRTMPATNGPLNQ